MYVQRHTQIFNRYKVILELYLYIIFFCCRFFRNTFCVHVSLFFSLSLSHICPPQFAMSKQKSKKNKNSFCFLKFCTAKYCFAFLFTFFEFTRSITKNDNIFSPTAAMDTHTQPGAHLFIAITRSYKKGKKTNCNLPGFAGEVKRKIIVPFGLFGVFHTLLCCVYIIFELPQPSPKTNFRSGHEEKKQFRKLFLCSETGRTREVGQEERKNFTENLFSF